MTQEEIIEGNKLIAEFMGYELAGPGFPSGYFVNNDYFHFENLKFHTSWNWLMPVVEKIESLGMQFWIGKYASSVTHEKIGDLEIHEKGNDKLIVIYNLSVKVIQWYNQQKQ